MIGDMKGHVKGRKEERGTKGNWKLSGRVNADSGLPSGKG
jgi:hypothetical protein